MTATFHFRLILVKYNPTKSAGYHVRKKKDIYSGFKLLFVKVIFPWNEGKSEVRTLLVCGNGFFISQVSPSIARSLKY
jgi:hypothetical protein